MKETTDTITRILGKHEQVVFAYLFGSTAREETTTASDVDIAVFLSGEKETHFETKLSIHADLCRTLKRNDVDLVVLNTATNLVLLDEIVREGDVLLDRAPDARTDFEIGVIHRAIDFKTQRMAIMGR